MSPVADAAAAPGAAGAGAAADLGRVALAVGPTAAAAGLQLLVFALSARALGPAAFGGLAAVYAVAAIATDAAGLGGDQAMVRAAARDPAGFPRAWGHALALLALSLVPVAALAAVAATLLVPGFGVVSVVLLVAGEVAVGRAAAAAELAFVAHGSPAGASLVRLAAVAARAATAVAVFAVAGARDPATWAVAACGQALVTAPALLAVASARFGRPRGGVAPEALGFGLLLMLTGLARSLNGNLDRVVLATVLAPAALGVYASAARLQLVGALLTQAATRLTAPRFFRAADAAARGRVTRDAARLMAVVGVVALALTALAAQALPVVLGGAFAGLVPLATGLAFACPFVALQYPPADALTAAGRQGLRTVVAWAAAPVSAGLLVVGARAAGPEGAVAGFVVAQALLAAAYWAAYRITYRAARVQVAR